MNRVGSCLSALLRVLAGILVAVFILALPVTLLAHNMASVLFSSEAVSRLLTAELIDSGLLRRTVVDQLLTSGAQASGAASLTGAMAHLTADQRDAIARQLLPDDWAKSQISSMAASVYAWLDNTDPAPRIQVDLQPVRDNLERNAGPIVQVIVGSWPACTLADLAKLPMTVFGSQDFPYCQPPEPLRSALVSTATQAVQEISTALPASLSLGESLSGVDPVKAEQTKSQLRSIRFLLRWAWVIPVALLGLIMAFAIRTWKGLGRWWGVSILGGGLASFLPVLLGPGLTRRYLEAWAAQAQMPAFLIDIVKSIGNGLMAAVMRPQAVEALALSVLGALMLIGSVILKGKAATAASGNVTVASAPPPPTPLVPPPSPPPETGDRPSGMFG